LGQLGGRNESSPASAELGSFGRRSTKSWKLGSLHPHPQVSAQSINLTIKARIGFT
jgi:hypothetical protein